MIAVQSGDLSVGQPGWLEMLNSKNPLDDPFVREKARLPIPDEVYHASPDAGLTELSPRRSTHGHSWVYAALDVGLAATQLSSWLGDFSCGTGRCDDDPIYVCERFEGALEARYGKEGGSIYVLPGITFKRGMTHFTEEVVSQVSVLILREDRIERSIDYLYELQTQGKLAIYLWPDRPRCVPEDDQDLVDKAVFWAKERGPGLLETIREYHPGLVDRVVDGIAKAQ